MIKKVLLGLLGLIIATWLITVLALSFEGHEYVDLSADKQAEAQAYFAGKLTPVPAAWQWQDFEPESGVMLRTGFINKDNAKGTVIVVPGFTGSIEGIMREILQIHAADYRVAAIEYRGQGASWRPLNHPEKGYVEDYGELGEDLAKFAKHVHTDDRPLFFYSISKGAHITMRMAAQRRPNVNAYALIVPMIEINTGGMERSTLHNIVGLASKLGLGRLYAPGSSAWPGDNLVFGQATDCNGNPDTAQTQSALFAMRKELRVKGVTMEWLNQTLSSSDLLASADYVESIKQPVKVFTAGIDTLVSTEATNQFCNSLAECETTHFESARHCITREDYSRYDKIVAEAIAHFDANL